MATQVLVVVTGFISAEMLKGGEYQKHLNDVIKKLEDEGYEVSRPIQPLYMLTASSERVKWYDVITTITYYKKEPLRCFSALRGNNFFAPLLRKLQRFCSK